MNVRVLSNLAGATPQEGSPEPYPPFRIDSWEEDGIYILYETHGTPDPSDDTPFLLFQPRGNTPEERMESMLNFLPGYLEGKGDTSLWAWSYPLSESGASSELAVPPSASNRILEAPMGEFPPADAESPPQTPEARVRQTPREPVMDPVIKQRLAEIRNDYSRDLDFLTFVGGQYLLAAPGVAAGIWAAGLGAGAIATGVIVAGTDVIWESTLRIADDAPPMETSSVLTGVALNVGPAVVSSGVTALGGGNRGPGSPMGQGAGPELPGGRSTMFNEHVLKGAVIERWKHGIDASKGLASGGIAADRPVKVVAADRGPTSEVRGYITQEKYVRGLTPTQMEAQLGLKPGTLKNGATVLSLDRVPEPHEFALRGYTQTPDGVPYQAGGEWPPGTGVPQWKLLADIPATQVHVVPPGSTYPAR